MFDYIDLEELNSDVCKIIKNASTPDTKLHPTITMGLSTSDAIQSMDITTVQSLDATVQSTETMVQSTDTTQKSTDPSNEGIYEFFQFKIYHKT